MLDDYKDTQQVIYNLLKKSINNNKISHAYLFEANNNPDAFNIVMAFVKSIICPKHNTNMLECNNCPICERIDNHNYLEIKIIEPEGTLIKKDQILVLQQEFSKKAIEGSKKIYIIKEAEKMNDTSANKLLKFLEEPYEGIIAILMTNNKNQLLDTIISRCQNISLSTASVDKYETLLEKIGTIIYNDSEKYNEFINDEKSLELINNVIKFIKKYEDIKLDMLIYLKNDWHNKFTNREESIIAFEIMINFYYDVLKYKEKKEIIIFKDYVEEIKLIAQNNNENELLRKLDVLVNTKGLINLNLNLSLLMDKFIMDMEGV